jgi:hypothetical protein
VFFVPDYPKLWVTKTKKKKKKMRKVFNSRSTACFFGQTSEGTRASRGYFRSQLRSDGKVVVTLSAQLFLFSFLFFLLMIIYFFFSLSLILSSSFLTHFSKIVLYAPGRRSNSCTSPFSSSRYMDIAAVPNMTWKLFFFFFLF